MTTRLIRFLQDRSGATALEYGMIIAVLSFAIVAGVGTVSEAYQDLFLRLANWFATGESPF